MEKRLGVVFVGGEGPSPDIARRLLDARRPLRDVAAGVLLVAADSGLILAEAAGLQPDWVVGDMDSLDDENRLRAYPAERVVRHAADKDLSDTELALALLWEQGCDSAWIVGGGGGRIGHLFGIRDLFERGRFPCRWITAAEDIYCIEQGETLVLPPLKQGNLVSVFPLGGGPWKAESRGLKWPLDNVRWERGLYGLSNVAVSETITVSAGRGRFMVILEELWGQL